MDNPIRSLRISLGLTQGDLVKLSTLSRMVVLRTEQGLYKSPSPLITSPLIELAGNPETLTHESLVEAYKASQKYQCENQQYWVKKLPTSPKRLWGNPDDSHPIVYFRGRWAPPVAKSRMGFCKAFCLHPNSMRLFESGEQLTVPSSLLVGLSLAGLTAAALDTLASTVLLWARAQE